MDKKGAAMRTRRAAAGLIAAAVICLIAVPAASASTPIRLVLDQGSAFSLLGHSCGGIQEQVYVTGFGPAPGGYPEGDAYLSTRCGGSGRGGGYKTTTYTAAASVVWNWLGQTRSFARLEGPGGGGPEFSAEDTHGDRIYNVGTAAYLETGEPPVQRPGAPTNVTASVGLYESGSTEYLRMSVGFSLAPETAGLVTSSTVTATPVPAGPPVLTATTSGSWTSAALGPVEPNTTYVVTVTSTDAEGTSESSEAVEIKSPNSDGEAEKGGGGAQHAASCEKNTGTIKLSPGLTETPHVQTITIKGTLGECGGTAGAESATYVAHLKTTEEVTCSLLQSFSAEPTTESVSVSVKWAPHELGTSHGTLVVPITEASGASLTGALESGPFSAPQAFTGGELLESFTGGPTCGVPQSGKPAKPVKKGVFSGTEVTLG